MIVFSTSHLKGMYKNHSPSTKVMKNFQLSITSIQFFKKKFVICSMTSNGL